jgi:cytoskeletal protein RodZ
MAELRRQNLKLVDDGQPPQEPHPITGQASEVARLLRGARARAGIELRDAAQALKIQYPYLVALEEGRFGELPGPTYALGFVRAYSAFLDLDPEEIVRRFKEEGQGVARRTALVFPEPIQEGRFPGGAALLVALVVAAVAYGGWYYYQSRDRIAVASIPPVPPGLAMTPPAPPPLGASGQNGKAASQTGDSAAKAAPSTASAATLSPDLSTAAQPAAPAIPSNSAVNGAIVVNNPPTAAAANTNAVQAAPPAAAAPSLLSPPQLAALPQAPDNDAAAKPNDTHVFGDENRDSRITIMAKQDSWVQVRDNAGAVVFTRLLHAGDSYRVPDEGGLVLNTGNAGGLDVIVDGRQVPGLGNSRVIRKNILLDPDRLLTGSAAVQ